MIEIAQTQLLLAPPGSGKTYFCLQKIQAVLRQDPFATVWVIVRDRLQAQAYRASLVRIQTTLGVEVATFHDLYHEVLQRSGSGLPVAEDATLLLLVRDVLDTLAGAGELPYFDRVQATPGFASALCERFAELKGALVLPERLESVARARQDPALVEIARLYAAYQARLQALTWTDAEGLGWLGLEALNAQPALLHDWRLVVVDGFDSLTPVQRRTVAALSRQVAEVILTLPGLPGMEQGDQVRSAHRRFAKTMRTLHAEMPLRLVSPPARPPIPAAFEAVESRLFAPPAGSFPEGAAIQLLEARFPADEVREALRWLKMRIVRDAISPADCALLIPDHATYHPALLAAATEFGMALRQRQGGRLSDTPPITALLDLLQLPLRSYPSRILLDTLRAPFFDFAALGLQRADAHVLEMVSRYGQILTGLAAWQDVLTLLAKQSGDPAAGAAQITRAGAGDLAGTIPPVEGSRLPPAVAAPGLEESSDLPDVEEQGVQPPLLPKGAQAAALWQGIAALTARIQPPDGDQSLEEWVRWLVVLLEELHFSTCCTQGIEAAWLATFDARLGVLARSERLAGCQPCSYAAFLGTLQGLLSSTTALEDPPAEDPAIQVLHTFEARGLRFQAVALVGLAEGIFPAVERADPMLSEEVRIALGLEPRLDRDQAGIFYQLVTRADQQLLLTRPYLAKDGETWEASPFWNAVHEVLGRPAVRVRPEDPRPLADAASSEELLFWAARRARRTGQSLAEPFASGWLERFGLLAHTQRVLLERVDGARASGLQGHLGAIESEIRQRFGGQATWSASRLEGFATCPFFFLAGSALGLVMVRPPKAGFETFQLGSLLHEVLERVFSESPAPGNLAAVLEHLPAVASQVFASAPAKYAFRPTLLWEIQQAELLETLRAAVVGLAELEAAAGWQPAWFECRFGIEGTPELWIPVDGQPVRLRGVIDRIDRDRHGNLRVIDYKSGGAHLAAQDLIDGRRLQLPLYALAAESALGLGPVAEGLYWKLFAQAPGGLRLARFTSERGQGPAGAYAMAVQHVERLVMAIRQGDFTPAAPEGGCPSYCPAASWCWDYQPKAVY